MPQWRNTLVAYHGTDDRWLNPNPQALGTYTTGAAVTFVPNLALCAKLTDFGQGFYVTTRLHQAEQWANAKVLRAGSGTSLTAIVLQFQLDREWLAKLDALAFVKDTREYWDFVTDCRHGFAPHQRLPPSPLPFDVVYGPVSLWRQTLIISDCDQISFHTRRAIAGFSTQPTIAGFGTTPDGNDMIF